MGLNLVEKVASYLEMTEKHKTKRNKKLYSLKINSDLRNKFIDKWFSESESILDKDQLKKDFIHTLDVRQEHSEIRAIERSIFSLAISCFYIERYGLEDINEFWFKKTLVEWIEHERLNLTIGNVEFYQLLAEERPFSEIIPGSLIKQIYSKYLPINSERKEKEIYELIERQSILLKISQSAKDEKFMFASPAIRLAVKTAGFKFECRSNFLAQKHLLF